MPFASTNQHHKRWQLALVFILLAAFALRVPQAATPAGPKAMRLRQRGDYLRMRGEARI
jgi:hypothetical protein